MALEPSPGGRAGKLAAQPLSPGHLQPSRTQRPALPHQEKPETQTLVGKLGVWAGSPVPFLLALFYKNRVEPVTHSFSEALGSPRAR